MLLELLSENGSLEKSRRAVLTVSLLILFFSAVEFRSDEIEIFSLVVAFSQDRFVALGQLCLLYFLAIYSIRLAVQIGSWVSVIGTQRVEKWEKTESDKIHEDMRSMSNDEYFGTQEMNEFDWVSSEARKRKTPYVYLKNSVSYFDFVSRIFFEYFIPILLATFAFCYPSSLSFLLKFFMQQ